MLQFDEIVLPQNRNFGFLFAAVFLIIAAYFFIYGTVVFASCFVLISLSFFVLACLNSAVLTPLNKSWMVLGYCLGLIISPLILGVVFFGFFTPLALLFRLVGRDEMVLKSPNKGTFWRKHQSSNSSFENQF